MLTIAWLWYILAGLFTGLLSGLLGIGGGIILIPLLHVLFSNQGVPAHSMMQLAAGTSLATIALITASATITHHRYYIVRWDFLRYLLPGLALGALIGTFIAGELPTDFLQLVFVLLIVTVAFRLLFVAEHLNTVESAPSWIVSLLATGIGSLSALVGVGGGILLVPLLKSFGLETRQVISTSATATFFVVTIGMFGALWFGHGRVDVPMATGYVYWPAVLILGLTGIIAAPIGIYLSHNLPVKLLKQLFAVVLFFVAFELLHAIDWIFLINLRLWL